MSFEVLNPGLLTLLQDAGRIGYQHIGVGSGGPMDDHGAYWANQLLGNHLRAPLLEITYGMLELEAKQKSSFALTGADLQAEIDGEEIKPWRTYTIERGQRLKFATPKAGMRAYLAVPGGFTVEPRLGSCATVMREGVGGLDGKGSKLAKQDSLPFEARVDKESRVPAWAIPDYTAAVELNVIPGYQFEEFDRYQQLRFFSSEYEISQNIDRMGYRLSGDAVKPRRTGIISEGIAYGAVQVPSDGQPIILLKDRQTIGGYPKLGCLTSLAAGQLAQRGPGARVGFRAVSLEEAEAERLLFLRRLQA